MSMQKWMKHSLLQARERVFQLITISMLEEDARQHFDFLPWKRTWCERNWKMDGWSSERKYKLVESL